MNKSGVKSIVYKSFSILYIIWGFWYIFFDSSIVLRPYYQYLWPALVIVGFIISVSSILNGCREIKKNTMLFFLFILVCFISILFSKDQSISFLYIQRLVLGYCFALVITSRNTDKVIINSIIIYCTILLLVSITQLYFTPIYYQYFLPLVNSDSELLQSGLKQGLAVGLTNGTSQNGLFMSVGFLPCAAYALYKKNNRFLYSFLAVCFFLMTFATGKRSYSIIILLELFALVLFRFRGLSKRKTIIFVIIISILSLCLFLVLADFIPVLSSFVSKFQELEEGGDITNGRIYIYKMTWNSFAENRYRMLGANTLVSIIGKEAHNSYLQWIVEFGLFFCWIPIYYMIRIPLSYYKDIIRRIRLLPDERIITIVIPFIFISQLLVSAFVAVPFQWHHVMTLFFVFQMMLLRNIKYNLNS